MPSKWRHMPSKLWVRIWIVTFQFYVQAQHCFTNIEKLSIFRTEVLLFLPGGARDWVDILLQGKQGLNYWAITASMHHTVTIIQHCLAPTCPVYPSWFSFRPAFHFSWFKFHLAFQHNNNQIFQSELCQYRLGKKKYGGRLSSSIRTS